MNKFFLGGIIIAIIAYVALAFIAPKVPSSIQGLIALPGAAGLLLALWELIKERIAHEYRVEEENRKNAFVLSATSHMANTAFDKHTAFCEKYTAKLNEVLILLIQNGPTTEALNYAVDLTKIRKSYIIWETKEITLLLEKFEATLRNIGAKEGLLKHINVGDERSSTVNIIYDELQKVLSFGDLPTDLSPELKNDVAIHYIINALSEHLGIPNLTRMRKFYLDEATKKTIGISE